MAITTTFGGIQMGPNMMSTVLPIGMLDDNVLPGMAFEPKGMDEEAYDHLDGRVKELEEARGSIQRSFFHRSMKVVKVVDPESGKKVSKREPTGWTPTRKYTNATGDLQKYVEGPFLDNPPLQATLPAFILYCPEQLVGTPADFNAGMGGEFHFYAHDPSKKFMIADGESRHLAIQRALSPTGRLSGTRREKLKSTLVSVVIIHGIPPQAMGQMFADLNGKGITLGTNEVAMLDIRDPWARATKEIFEKLKVPLVDSGRQVGLVHQAEGKHLIIGQAITMVKGLGTGSISKATSTSALLDDIMDDKQYDKVVKAGGAWFGAVLEHFESVVEEGQPAASIFTHPDYVLKSMPIKVALGVMGHAWVATNLPKQLENKQVLDDVNWRVDPRWHNIAGKISEKTVAGKVDGKKVKTVVAGEYVLAAASAKEMGGAAVQALTSTNTKAWRAVRGIKETAESAGMANADAGLES